MTYPFMEDPVPPGHGESLRVEERDRVYSLIVVLGDGNPEVEERFTRLDKAVERRGAVRAQLRAQGYNFFFVGIMDEDDPESGWLGDDD